MKCAVCDKLLNEYEIGRKHPAGYVNAGEYSDTCTDCTESISDILFIDSIDEDIDKT
jgi:hypothetical protein